MRSYEFLLKNSADPHGEISGRELPDDGAALNEAATAVGELVASELSEGRATPFAVAVVKRDGITIGVATASALVERFS